MPEQRTPLWQPLRFGLSDSVQSGQVPHLLSYPETSFGKSATARPMKSGGTLFPMCVTSRENSLPV